MVINMKKHELVELYDQSKKKKTITRLFCSAQQKTSISVFPKYAQTSPLFKPLNFVCNQCQAVASNGYKQTQAAPMGIAHLSLVSIQPWVRYLIPTQALLLSYLAPTATSPFASRRPPARPHTRRAHTVIALQPATPAPSSTLWRLVRRSFSHSSTSAFKSS
jgi:hypothetical protein